MEFLSSFLIKSDDDYYSQLEKYEEYKCQNYLEEKNLSNLNDKLLFYQIDNSNSIIEHVEEQNYLIKDQELKYKIFDDISSVTKNFNDKIELIINIPKSSDIMTINKIKLSKNIKQFIFDIFVSLNDKIIMNKDNLYNKQMILCKKINYEECNESNYIDCSKGSVNIHIVLEPNSINEIINNNIYINFSFINYKNKIKFLS